MGILNVTPDSFSDGNQYNNLDSAYLQAEKMLKAGADIIDIGGESTRPGAAEVTADEEIDRVVPVIQRIKSLGLPISIDTSKAQVMEAAVKAGASMINDVRAFSREGAIEAVIDSSVALCVMHMQGAPVSMQEAPSYLSVVDEVCDFLRASTASMVARGIDSERLLVDPGFGFGKTLQHNMQILKGIGRFTELGFPVLVGLSRKSMFSEILNKPVDERLFGSLSGAVIAACQGAKIIRAHDVMETKDAARVVDAMNKYAN